MSVLREWSGLGPGCPGQWGSPHPWRGSNTVWMWPLGTWFSRHGGVGVTVGLDLRGLFQPFPISCHHCFLPFSRSCRCPLQHRQTHHHLKTSCYSSSRTLLLPHLTSRSFPRATENALQKQPDPHSYTQISSLNRVRKERQTELVSRPFGKQDLHPVHSLYREKPSVCQVSPMRERLQKTQHQPTLLLR